MRKDGGNDTTVVSQGLVAETEMLKKLHHPNLPSIVDVIDTEDSFIIVMDYIEGRSLQDLLDTSGPQPVDLVVDWAKQLCDVLGYLHSSKLRIGDEVVMEATRKGESFAIKTCPLVITEAKPDALPNPIIVYPTQAPRHMPVITIEAPRGGQYAIYSSTGSLLSEGKMEEGTTQVKLPSVCGIYFIHTSQGKDTETHKVLLY